MKQYIVELSRTIGIGNDLINFFNKRGYEVIWEDREVLDKTIIVETSNCFDELLNLKYVLNATEARNSFNTHL